MCKNSAMGSERCSKYVRFCTIDVWAPKACPWCLTATHKTLKQNIRTDMILTLLSLSRMRYTDLVNRLIKVSLSEVVWNIRFSFNFITLHITSMAVCNWPVESQLPSLAVVFDFPPFGAFLVGAAVAGFSAALVSTADMVHCNRKAYISSSCLWWCNAPVSSLS